MKRLSFTAYAIIVGVLLSGGLYAGWRMYAPKPAPPEPPAPAVRQKDNSLILERRATQPAKPKHGIPKDGVVERVMEVKVEPDQLNAVKAGDTTTPCPPVTVDLSLVRMPDETRRVIASSPNGTIVGGVDIPVEMRTARKELKWSTGLSVNPLERTPGVFIDHDFGPFRVGAELNLLSGATGVDVRIKAGINF